MKQFAKRSIAILLALILCIGILSGLHFTAGASTVDVNYVYGSTSQYSNYSNIIANWGERGKTATFLSQNAADFYEENAVSYAELAALSGSANLNTVSSSDLYTALQDLMVSNHDSQTTYGETRDLYAYTDCQNSDITTLSCFYSGISLKYEWDGGATWNREHTWPKSKTEQKDCNNNTTGEVADIMMLRPADKNLNSSRNNKAYGESTGYYYPNTNENYDVRGDVARIMLYVYVRWGNTQYMWGANGVVESLDVLLDWMEEDPVDTWELGRNDSVESITGTRNVFVDYPELAFLLFDEDIPADMTTPSGEGYTGAYTITATVNGNGTVQVNGNTITATADEGYEVSGCTVISGDATVTRNGNVFTVIASSDCTVQINFSARTLHSVFFVENGAVTTSLTAYSGDAVVLPTAVDVPEGYAFVGWSDVSIDDAAEVSGIYKASESYILSANTILYAVYSYEKTETATQYLLVTDASVLKAGEKVIIAAAGSDYALSTTQENNYRGRAVVSKSGAVVTFGEDVQVLTLEVGTVSGTYAFNTGSGYLSAGSSSNNYLKTNTSKNDNSSFKIEINNGVATIVAQGSYKRNMILHNPGASRFSCYAALSTATENVCLYAETTVDGASVTYYTTGAAFVCNHSSKDHVDEVAATCRETGVKAHDECTVCGVLFADGAEVSLDALVLPVDPENHSGILVIDQAEATCTENGYTGDTWCAACDTLVEKGEVILSEGHDLIHIDAEEATCRTTGLKEHDRCNVCGKNFVDGVEVSEDDVRVPTLEHSYGDWEIVTEATEETDGLRQHTCTGCGYVEEEVIPATGADQNEDNADTKPEDKEEDEIPAGDDKSDDTNDDDQDNETEEVIKPSDNSQTGDSAPLLTLVVLLVMAACGIAALHIVPAVRRKR